MPKPKTYNKYQYETSPRKLEPIEPSKKVKYKKKSTAKRVGKKPHATSKFKKIVYVVLSFSVLFAICYGNSQINESFSRVQELREDLSQIQKTNEQLNVSIQNSLNLQQIEQKAKELLGMQKLTNKQTIYVNLPKSDYVEPATEKIIVQTEEKGLFENLSEKISELFNKDISHNN